MTSLSRIVWSEGMHLAPHHFQTQAAYFDSLIQFTTTALWTSPYGFAGLELDAAALRNGTVSLIHARGVFEDGLAFNMPESDPLPEPRQVAEIFPPASHKLEVSIAVPRRKPGAANCALQPNGNREKFRYIAEERFFPDDVGGLDEKPVKVGRKNIRLHLETEPDEGLESMAIARVLRDGAGGFVYDPAFVPPCLDIGASPSLMSMLQRLVSILKEKSEILHKVARGARGHQTGLSAEQVATFWFLHAMNHALPILNHLCAVRHGHPCALFLEMSRLGGALCTFGLESHPRNLPLYDHKNLEACFDLLDTHIRQHLELIIPSNCIQIPLQSAGNYFYEADVTDARCFGPSRWILGVQARLGEAELIRQVPQLVKLCSSAFVRELMRRALPGMTLTHLPSPPAAVSPKVDWQYFAIDRAGPCWDHLRTSKRAGVYAPGQLPDPSIELLVILDS